MSVLRTIGVVSDRMSSFIGKRELSRKRSSVWSNRSAVPHLPQASDDLQLGTYGISPVYGFLLTNPLEHLREPFSIWSDVAHELDILVEEHRVREVIDKWPLLDAGDLTRSREQYLAQSILSNLAACYIWQEGEADPATRIPPQLAVPLCHLSDYLGVEPSISVLSIVLTNWKLKDKDKPVSLSNIDTIFPLPGGEKTKWFSVVSIYNEIVAAPGIEFIVDAIRSVELEDDFMLANYLKLIDQCIKKISMNAFAMFDHLKPEDFYNILRPFFAGYGGPGSFIKDGVVFEGVSEDPRVVPNASAAQSSTIQCFDAALRIEHEPERKAFLLSTRKLMPPRHRKFIEAIERAPNIRDYVEITSNPDLLAAYNGAVTRLVDFRRVHLHLVKRYVVNMKDTYGLTETYGSVATTAFNGSNTIDYLKGFADATREHQIKATIQRKQSKVVN